MTQETEPRLLAWLIEAAQQVDVIGDLDEPLRFRVEVSNGRRGDEREAAIIARCESWIDAELVAAGLRRLANG